MRRSRVVCTGFITLLCGAGITAQSSPTSHSAPLALELGRLLQENKLTTIAAEHAEEPGRFVAAMHFPGTQLLAVSADHASPAILREQIWNAKDADVYGHFNSGAIPEGKLFVQDLGADGLHRQGTPFDIVYESVVHRTVLDGNWKEQKLSQQEYDQRFERADRRYAAMLSSLIGEVRRRASAVP